MAFINEPFINSFNYSQVHSVAPTELKILIAARTTGEVSRLIELGIESINGFFIRSSAGPFCCLNGAQNEDCCANNGVGPYCCTGGDVNSPDCKLKIVVTDDGEKCKGGIGKLPYCCANGAENADCCANNGIGELF